MCRSDMLKWYGETITRIVTILIFDVWFIFPVSCLCEFQQKQMIPKCMCLLIDDVIDKQTIIITIRIKLISYIFE